VPADATSRRTSLIDLRRCVVQYHDHEQEAEESALKVIIEIIGWTAAVMMLSAYLLLTSGRLSSSSGSYQWLNVFAGAGLIINSGWNGAYPSVFLNVIWITIGLYGVLRGTRIRANPVT